jgi:hypothetical protein
MKIIPRKWFTVSEAKDADVEARRAAEEPFPDPKKYRSNHFVEYETPERRGYTSVEVLPFLKGRKWDSVALGYVHSLRPSGIRVVGDGWCTSDAITWRVTVHVDGDTIKNIEQEVEVGLPPGVVHGAALNTALKHGVDSAGVRSYRESMEKGVGIAVVNPRAITRVMRISNG